MRTRTLPGRTLPNGYVTNDVILFEEDLSGLLPRPTELVCEECMAGDHRTCSEGGGYMDDEDNEPRCGCHLTAHRLDNRGPAKVGFTQPQGGPSHG